MTEMRGLSGGTSRDLTATLALAIRKIDNAGRLRTEDARAFRRALRHAGKPVSALLAEPDETLGPFESLPPPSRQALKDLVDRDSRWRMSAFSVGRWHEGASRALWSLHDKLRWGSRRRAAVELLASAVQAGPFFAVPAARRALLTIRARFLRRPRLPDVFAAARIEVRDLAVRYVRHLHQEPRFRGFWHDERAHSTVGVIVGLDFIENADGLWLVESNMNCGLEIIRTVLFKDDPFVRSLLDMTASMGYRRLVIVSGNTSVDEEMTRQYREGAPERGLELRLFEDAFRRRFGHPGTVGLPENGVPGTLIVRNRHYRTPLDWLIHHKRASSRALRIYKQESGDTSFRLAPTGRLPVIAPADPEDPFPNVVFKLPESDDGEGVLFMKVSGVEHAREVLSASLQLAPRRRALSRLYARFLDREGVYQSYIRTPWTSDRRLFKTRAYVVLTPAGVQFLAAHRLVGCKPVPTSLPMGVVVDQLPYLVNWRPGSRLETIPPEALPAVRRAALGVARGLAGAIEYGFESGAETAPRGASSKISSSGSR